ncbi:MAG: carboxypeptidase-like regulatory domain-containing protein, partial [Bacteroidota bacterium]
MKKKITTVLMFLLLLFGFSSFSQEVEVSGTVTSSEDGLPMPGVSVVVIGTITGTATDFDGNYTLTTEIGQELQFNFMGYSVQVHAVSGTTMDVVMQPDAKALEEVVVTALGISKEKKALGYAVTNLGEDDLNRSGETNVIQSLSSKAAGV